ncbi:MAG: TIGR00282 family metallophosphoesterase [Candidatus Azambacteria bacterium]|nr:TIGR00282 family metallophosphoesterase [Candidatus Azambacteria bacterium]
MKIIFIGDVMGRPGREAVERMLPSLKEEFAPDFVICNGENLAHGAGVTRKVVDEMFTAGVDALTSGNHIFDKKDASAFLAEEQLPVIRPLNFQDNALGRGYMEFERKGKKIILVNIIGTLFMGEAYRNPFLVMSAFLKDRADDGASIIVDFHAETTSEKRAMGFYLDGKVSALLGTHTHVPTADAQILLGGTAYITDVGMTGTTQSVIGMEKDAVIRAFCGEQARPDIAEGEVALDAVVIDINDDTGRARSITQIHRVLVR